MTDFGHEVIRTPQERFERAAMNSMVDTEFEKTLMGRRNDLMGGAWTSGDAETDTAFICGYKAAIRDIENAMVDCSPVLLEMLSHLVEKHFDATKVIAR